MDDITVVVGVGQSDENRIDDLVDTVRKLVRSADDEVILAHVYDESDRETLEEMLDLETEHPDQLAIATRHNTAVREVVDDLETHGIDPAFRGRFGEPGEELVAIAEADGADFLVAGGRKRSPVGKALFGSTAQEVLLSAPCPVVFFRGQDV